MFPFSYPQDRIVFDHHIPVSSTQPIITDGTISCICLLQCSPESFRKNTAFPYCPIPIHFSDRMCWEGNDDFSILYRDECWECKYVTEIRGQKENIQITAEKCDTMQYWVRKTNGIMEMSDRYHGIIIIKLAWWCFRIGEWCPSERWERTSPSTLHSICTLLLRRIPAEILRNYVFARTVFSLFRSLKSFTCVLSSWSFEQEEMCILLEVTPDVSPVKNYVSCGCLSSHWTFSSSCDVFSRNETKVQWFGSEFNGDE